jgi:hypothetical protein
MRIHHQYPHGLSRRQIDDLVQSNHTGTHKIRFRPEHARSGRRRSRRSGAGPYIWTKAASYPEPAQRWSSATLAEQTRLWLSRPVSTTSPVLRPGLLVRPNGRYRPIHPPGRPRHLPGRIVASRGRPPSYKLSPGLTRHLNPVAHRPALSHRADDCARLNNHVPHAVDLSNHIVLDLANNRSVDVA